MTTLSQLLDAIGVGRPLPDGSPWTRAAFCLATGIEAHDLSPSRYGSPRQERIALALTWALALIDGRTPDGWDVAQETRTLTLSILRARARARAEMIALSELPYRILRWRICPSRTSAEVLAELAAADPRVQLAALVGGWAGVERAVREVAGG